MNSGPDELQRLRDHAWDYFALHADQRLKAFNFYLILATVIVGGVLGVLKDLNSRYSGCVLALSLPALSFLFWKLDRRTRELIRHGEAALIWWESQLQLMAGNHCPHVASLFAREEHLTGFARRRKSINPLNLHMSYSDCFNAVFLLFAIIGLMLGVTLALGPAKSSAPGGRSDAVVSRSP
jgi:hypothetical protein